MRQRRFLSVWFPRLAAERAVRAEPQLAGRPIAVVEEVGGTLRLASLTREAERAGLVRGMAVGDARAILPDFLTRPEDPPRAAAFLGALRRWAGRFSPWAAEEGPESLLLDITGCAHLFGGEAGLAGRAEADATGFGLSLRLGIADTLGAAWAVARFGWAGTASSYAGDAIDIEARATRSRAEKRRRAEGSAPPGDGGSCIVPLGRTLVHIGPLPVAALRLEPGEVAALQGLGLRRIADLTLLPRAQLARRAGPGVVRRLDQALGRASEPVSPAQPPRVFAVRLTFPEPIGRAEDVIAGIERLLSPLCLRLGSAGQGARRVRLTMIRTDGGLDMREVGLARPSARPEAIRPLLMLKLGEIDAGFGFEALRLQATAIESLSARQHRGQVAATAAAMGPAEADRDEDMADLLGRLGARLGLDALIRLHPAESHVPEKSATEMAAVFSAPANGWLRPPSPGRRVLSAGASDAGRCGGAA